MLQQPVTVSPLAGSLGARVDGVDLSRPIDDAMMDVLRAAFLDHCVLVFPQQEITPQEQAAFAERWGQLHLMPTLQSRLDGHPGIVEIDFRGKRPSTDIWHTDMSMNERPPLATFLLARRIPPAGGDTMFANQYLAYEALSEGMQAMLAGLAAVHDGATFAAAAGLDPASLPTSLHPVVRTHPETGRKALYVNAIFTRRFDNMTVEESAPLLNWLYAHCSQPNLTFRHRWSVGDLVMWDNRCTQHFAIADYDSTQRTMNRATVFGDRPC